MVEREIPFNDDFVSGRLSELLALKIDRSIITAEQISKVTELLELTNNSEVQLRAKRNSVVKLLTEDKYRYDDAAWATMSGATCVIDTYLMKYQQI